MRSFSSRAGPAPQVRVELRGGCVGPVAAQRAAHGHEHPVLEDDLVVARRRERGGGDGRAAVGRVDDGGGREGEEGRLGARREAARRAAKEGLACDVVIGVIPVPPLRTLELSVRVYPQDRAEIIRGR